MIRTGLLLAIAADLAFAAGPLSGPVAGYVTARGPELRAILGVPGAFRFSDPIALPEGTFAIRLAPGQQYAILDRRGAVPAAAVLDSGEITRTIPIEGAIRSSDWVAFSATGASAVLYSAAEKRMQVVTGLPDAPAVRDVDPSTVDGPQMGAVSDDGEFVIAATQQAVYAIGSAARLLFSGSDISAVTMLRDGRSAVADRGAGTLQIIEAGLARVLASGLDGLGEICAGSDGATLYAARGGSVAAIDLLTGNVREFETSAGASSLMRLRNRDTFLISAWPGEPGWIFYRDGSEGRSVFVPALPPGERTRRGGER